MYKVEGLEDDADAMAPVLGELTAGQRGMRHLVIGVRGSISRDIALVLRGAR
jgi:hypothetical protein